MSAKSNKNVDIRQKIVESALYLAVAQGWEYTTLRDIAQHSGISASDLYDVIDDKNDILVILGKIIDKKLLDNIDISEDDSISSRDRLFDILMDRYEALNDYRDGVAAIFESFKYDPKQIIISMPHLCRSISWMLEMSTIETAGVSGMVKVVGLTGFYIKVLKVWIKDDSKDLSKTMAALDQALDRAESAANLLGF